SAPACCPQPRSGACRACHPAKISGWKARSGANRRSRRSETLPLGRVTKFLPQELPRKSFAWFSRRVCEGRIRSQRQLDHHGRAEVYCALNGKCAAVQVDDGLCERQSQSRALVHGIEGGPSAVEGAHYEGK